MRTPLSLLVLSLCAIAAIWWWLAIPITLARAPIDPAAKLECVSYAPFRGNQSPLVKGTHIAPEQIAEDFTQLARISKCVRTYSVQNGLDKAPELARKAGLKLILGIWLGSNRVDNVVEIATAVQLAKEYSDVISAVVVGNEVLLRGEMTAADLAANIRSVKAQVKVPVTYADVWEYWLRNRDIYEAVDFVTIHILPYWEDLPVPARYAASHVDSIRKRVAVAFPGKEILIGETGWPSAGRMREGALPSRANQARVVSEILTLAKQENFRVNLIEAYDQPWKRQLEGTVGGYWGLIDAKARAEKYPAGAPINNFPMWKPEMAAGMVLCALIFMVAMWTARRRPWAPRFGTWLGVAGSATAAGALLGVAIDKLLTESLGMGGWIQWGLLLAAGIASPLLAASVQMSGRSLPTFLEVIGPRQGRATSRRMLLLALMLGVTTVIATETALGLVFDPRYKDFPFAALTMAVVPFWMLMVFNRPHAGARPIAEAVFGGLLVIASVYIAFNEGIANWQSLWTCLIYVMLGITLWRARVAQNPE